MKRDDHAIRGTMHISLPADAYGRQTLLTKFIGLGDFTLMAGLWGATNVLANYVGLETLATWWEWRNGGMALDPLYTHPAAFLFVSVAASFGQALLQQYPEARRSLGYFTFAIILMAFDLALSTFGLYTRAMPVPFGGVPVHSGFLVAALLVAFVGGVGCQYRAHWVLSNVLLADLDDDEEEFEDDTE